MKRDGSQSVSAIREVANDATSEGAATLAIADQTADQTADQDDDCVEIDPVTCPVCGSIDVWQSIISDEWKCSNCHPPNLDAARRLLAVKQGWERKKSFGKTTSPKGKAIA